MTAKGFGKIKRTQIPFDSPFPANAGRNSLVQFLTDKSEQESRKARTDQKIKEIEPKKVKTNRKQAHKGFEQYLA